MSEIEEIHISDDAELLPEYLSHFPGLVQDLAHWHGYGITTPRQLGDYLDMSCAISVYKSEYGVKPRFETAEEARKYLDEK
jgi:hypothetical protein